MSLMKTVCFKNFMKKYLYAREMNRKPQRNAFRIYKTEQHDKGVLIRFSFWGNHEKVEALYSHKNVLIDGKTYSYIRVDDSIQAIVISEDLEMDLYDHWIQFI